MIFLKFSRNIVNNNFKKKQILFVILLFKFSHFTLRRNQDKELWFFFFRLCLIFGNFERKEKEGKKIKKKIRKNEKVKKNKNSIKS